MANMKKRVSPVLIWGCGSETVAVATEPSFDEAGRPIINIWAGEDQAWEAAPALPEELKALPAVDPAPLERTALVAAPEGPELREMDTGNSKTGTGAAGLRRSPPSADRFWSVR